MRAAPTSMIDHSLAFSLPEVNGGAGMQRALEVRGGALALEGFSGIIPASASWPRRGVNSSDGRRHSEVSIEQV